MNSIFYTVTTTHANYEATTASGLTVTVKKGKTTINVADLLEFSTDVAGCNVYSLQGYTAADYLTMTTSTT